MDVEEHTEAKEPEPMQVETPAKVAKKNREQKFLADLEVAEAAARKLAEVQGKLLQYLISQWYIYNCSSYICCHRRCALFSGRSTSAGYRRFVQAGEENAPGQGHLSIYPVAL